MNHCALLFFSNNKVFTPTELKSISVECRKVKKQCSFQEFIKNVNQSVASKSVFDTVQEGQIKYREKKIPMRLTKYAKTDSNLDEENFKVSRVSFQFF